MSFTEDMQKKKDLLRKQQADLKKCIDDIFNEKVMKIVQEEFDYQAKCPHPNIITTTSKDGSGSRSCPECGWWCAWGVYSTEPAPPPPYPLQDEVQAFVKHHFGETLS